ncbi:MAG: 2-amino-4-hydroxy-6-hydroxymethyldihydropteridine diphosphokinase [Candidatus Coproplasma sp.]
MSEIEIEGLEFSACHGVYQTEKQNPQPFVFGIKMQVDFDDAAAQDELDATVNYGSVCAEIKKVVLGSCFNLIETLARECALCVLEKFPRVYSVTVKVEKPQAPIKEKFKTVSVTYTAERSRVLLSLGSSQGDRKDYLDRAVKLLSETRGITVKKVSDYIVTEPYGGVARNKFLNCAAEVECLLSPHLLLKEIHRIESALGRVRERRWDDRTADIDIVFFGDKIIYTDELKVPHPDYANRDFVLTPLKQIAPDFVCPLRKKPIGEF